MIRRVWLLAILCGVFLSAAGVAFACATAPFTDAFGYHGSTDCGTFSVLYVGHEELRGVTTSDNRGRPVRDIVTITRWEQNSRSDDPSVSFTSKSRYTLLFDYATGITRQIRTNQTVTAPGPRVLYHSVAYVSNETSAGHAPNDGLEQGGSAFCEALKAVTT